MKKSVLIIFSLFTLYSCKPEPQPIEFGQDSCHHCKMTIVDQRYGAELVTKKGKIYKYDAVECLVNSLFFDKVVDDENIHSIWAIDSGSPGTLVKSGKCSFLHSKNLPSPMGMYLTAFADSVKLKEAQEAHGGNIFTWKETVDYVIAAKKPG